MPIWMLRLEPHGVWAGQPAGRVPHSPSPRSYPSSRWRHRSGPQNLQAHVLIDRPENVREYMIEYLSNMKKVRAAHRRAGLIATDYVSCDRSPALLRAWLGLLFRHRTRRASSIRSSCRRRCVRVAGQSDIVCRR